MDLTAFISCQLLPLIGYLCNIFTKQLQEIDKPEVTEMFKSNPFVKDRFNVFMLDSSLQSKDRLMLVLLFTHLTIVLIFALLTAHTDVNVLAVTAFLVPLLVFKWKPGTLLSRCMIAISMVVFSGTLIHLSNGLIEMHFHVFVILVVLSLYNDWRVFALAALGIALHHLIGLMQPYYNVYAANPNLGIYALHILFVSLECIFLSYQIGSFRHKLETISHQNQRLKNASRQLLVVTTDINTTASQQAVSSQQQLFGIRQTTDMMRELTASARTIASRTNQIKYTAEEMLLSSQQINTTTEAVAEAGKTGNKTVSQTIFSSQQVSAVYKSHLDLLEDLQQRSSEIKEVVSVIREISDEIHLLALNATIEAKGAGLHGLRFEVIAREVNELADRSTKASKQVEHILGQVEAQINETVVSSSSGQAEISKSVSLAEQSGIAIAKLLNAISQNNQEVAHIEKLVADVSHSATEINAAATQQYLACSQAAQTLEQAETVAQQTVVGSSLLNNTAHDLENLSYKLKGTITI